MHMNSLHLTLRILICLWLVGPFPGADAAQVTDLYAAQVPIGEGGARGSFDTALHTVLIKVTGRRDVTEDQTVMSQFIAAEPYVQQYLANPDGTVWVLFDQVALRRTLDSIGQPVWGQERPVTLTWLVMDHGTGSRDILAAEADVESETGMFADPLPVGDLERQTAVREILQTTAAERGLPLILPLVDSEELDIVSVPDVWGGFTESLVLASQRYGVNAILVGRARVLSVETAQVRWTLMLGEERFDWDGDIASGPDRLADFFAARLATSSSALGRMQLRVDGVNSLEDYGRLSQYLSTLDVVEEYSVERVNDQTIIFSLLVRGDADRLMRSIALRRILQPIEDSRLDLPGGDPQGIVIPRVPSVDSFAGETADLHYSLIVGP